MPVTSMATLCWSIATLDGGGGVMGAPCVGVPVLLVTRAMVDPLVALMSGLQTFETTRRDSRQDRTQEHERHQHERSRPGLTMPVFIRGDGIGEHLDRQRGDRLTR